MSSRKIAHWTTKTLIVIYTLNRERRFLTWLTLELRKSAKWQSAWSSTKLKYASKFFLIVCFHYFPKHVHNRWITTKFKSFVFCILFPIINAYFHLSAKLSLKFIYVEILNPTGLDHLIKSFFQFSQSVLIFFCSMI